MFEIKQNRNLDFSKPVQVYRNLNKCKLHDKNCKVYSVKQKGLVVGYCDWIALKDCILHTNQKGFDRVRQTGRREVVSWISGTITNLEQNQEKYLKKIEIDPRQNKDFPQKKSDLVLIDQEGVKIKIQLSWITVAEPQPKLIPITFRGNGFGQHAGEHLEVITRCPSENKKKNINSYHLQNYGVYYNT